MEESFYRRIIIHARRVLYRFSWRRLHELREASRRLDFERACYSNRSIGVLSGSARQRISIVIATYNKADVLVNRTLPSVLSQTHRNIEVIVVGDACTDETERKIKEMYDCRIKFLNLKKRGNYPENPSYRWMVAGVEPRNKALELVTGDWIATTDDDDEFFEDHLEALLKFALSGDYEMVYGKVLMETEDSHWKEVGAWPLRCGHITHMSVLYRSYLKFLRYDIQAWKYGEYADWNFWKRMKDIGVRIGFLDAVVGRHYKERSRWGV